MRYWVLSSPNFVLASNGQEYLIKSIAVFGDPFVNGIGYCYW